MSGTIFNYSNGHLIAEFSQCAQYYFINLNLYIKGDSITHTVLTDNSDLGDSYINQSSGKIWR